MLTAAARRLDPPKQRSRRWPRVLAGTVTLAAAGAAATAVILRSRSRELAAPLTPRPAARDNMDQSVKVVNPNAEAERDMSEADLNGLSRTR